MLYDRPVPYGVEGVGGGGGGGWGGGGGGGGGWGEAGGRYPGPQLLCLPYMFFTSHLLNGTRIIIFSQLGLYIYC